MLYYWIVRKIYKLDNSCINSKNSVVQFLKEEVKLNIGVLTVNYYLVVLSKISERKREKEKEKSWRDKGFISLTLY